MFKIAIFADGSKDIGMGHIMRCISLAKALKERFCEVIFVCRFDHGAIKVKSHGFEVIKTDESRYFIFEEVIKVLSKGKFDIAIFDSYDVSINLFNCIRAKVNKIGYIDDIHQKDYPVDILINGNIDAGDLNYNIENKKTLFLIGSKYNLIRDEFENLIMKNIDINNTNNTDINNTDINNTNINNTDTNNTDTNNTDTNNTEINNTETNNTYLNKNVTDVKSIMITTGGSDFYNLTPLILKLIVESGLVFERINVIIGSGFENKDELYTLKDRHPCISLHENVTRISTIMLDSDIAISTGGSTLYELCACGVPTIGFMVAENQSGILEKMNCLGCVISIGEYTNIHNNLIEKIKYLIKKYQVREEMVKRGMNLVDAKGAKRVADEIIKSFDTKSVC